MFSKNQYKNYLCTLIVAILLLTPFQIASQVKNSNFDHTKKPSMYILETKQYTSNHPLKRILLGVAVCCFVVGVSSYVIYKYESKVQSNQSLESNKRMYPNPWAAFKFAKDEWSWPSTYKKDKYKNKITPIAPKACKVNKAFVQHHFFPPTESSNFLIKDVSDNEITDLSIKTFKKIFIELQVDPFEQTYTADSLEKQLKNINEKISCKNRISITTRNIRVINAGIAYLSNKTSLALCQKDQTKIDEVRSVAFFATKAVMFSKGQCYGAIKNLAIIFAKMLSVDLYEPATSVGKIIYPIAKYKEIARDQCCSMFVFKQEEKRRKNEQSQQLWNEDEKRDYCVFSISTYGTHIQQVLQHCTQEFMSLGHEIVSEKDYNNEKYSMNQVYGFNRYSRKETIVKPLEKLFYEQCLTPENIVNLFIEGFKSNSSIEKKQISFQDFVAFCKTMGCNQDDVVDENYIPKKEYVAGVLEHIGILEKR